jgi:hypothetical protein
MTNRLEHPNVKFSVFDRDGHSEAILDHQVIGGIDKEPFPIGGFIFHAYSRPEGKQLYSGSELLRAKQAIIDSREG